MRLDKHCDNCVSCDNVGTEKRRDKLRKYDPCHEVFMSGNTSDCHIATLISSGQHSAHFSSLALQKYFNICKKTPRRPRTGSQLRVEWWGIIFGINIWAIWWRSTRHRTGDESLENAEPRVIPGSRVAVEADFTILLFLEFTKASNMYYRHVQLRNEKFHPPMITRWSCQTSFLSSKNSRYQTTLESCPELLYLVILITSTTH